MQNPKPGIYVTLEELTGLRFEALGLHWQSPQMGGDQQSGDYASAQRGRGMEFHEVRAYQAGDDIRSMDWRVTARTGKPHTKLYVQERERPVYIIVDLNASMFFGTKVAFKSHIAIKTAALLAWAATKHGDKAGGMILSKKGLQEFKPQRRQILPFLKAMTEASYDIPCGKPFSLTIALERLQRVIRPGSLVYVISDFHSLDEAAEKQMRRLSLQQSMTSICIYDTLEKVAPPDNYYAYSDGQQYTSLDTSDLKMRHAYAQGFEQHLEKLRNLCTSSGTELLELATHDPLVKSLNHGRMGARRQRHA